MSATLHLDSLPPLPSDGDPTHTPPSSDPSWSPAPPQATQKYIAALSAYTLDLIASHPSLKPLLLAREPSRGNVEFESDALLSALPAGYRLFQKQRKTGHRYSDVYMFGHPKGSRFRSTNEFLPHLQWLLLACIGEQSVCHCIYCDGLPPVKMPVLPSSPACSPSGPPTPPRGPSPTNDPTKEYPLRIHSTIPPNPSHQTQPALPPNSSVSSKNDMDIDKATLTSYRKKSPDPSPIPPDAFDLDFARIPSYRKTPPSTPKLDKPSRLNEAAHPFAPTLSSVTTHPLASSSDEVEKKRKRPEMEDGEPGPAAFKKHGLHPSQGGGMLMRDNNPHGGSQITPATNGLSETAQAHFMTSSGQQSQSGLLPLPTSFEALLAQYGLTGVVKSNNESVGHADDASMYPVEHNTGSASRKHESDNESDDSSSDESNLDEYARNGDDSQESFNHRATIPPSGSGQEDDGEKERIKNAPMVAQINSAPPHLKFMALPVQEKHYWRSLFKDCPKDFWDAFPRLRYLGSKQVRDEERREKFEAKEQGRKWEVWPNYEALLKYAPTLRAYEGMPKWQRKYWRDSFSGMTDPEFWANRRRLWYLAPPSITNKVAGTSKTSKPQKRQKKNSDEKEMHDPQQILAKTAPDSKTFQALPKNEKRVWLEHGKKLEKNVNFWMAHPNLKHLAPASIQRLYAAQKQKQARETQTLLKAPPLDVFKMMDEEEQTYWMRLGQSQQSVGFWRSHPKISYLASRRIQEQLNGSVEGWEQEPADVLQTVANSGGITTQAMVQNHSERRDPRLHQPQVVSHQPTSASPHVSATPASEENKTHDVAPVLSSNPSSPAQRINLSDYLSRKPPLASGSHLPSPSDSNPEQGGETTPETTRTSTVPSAPKPAFQFARKPETRFTISFASSRSSQNAGLSDVLRMEPTENLPNKLKTERTRPLFVEESFSNVRRLAEGLSTEMYLSKFSGCWKPKDLPEQTTIPPSSSQTLHAQKPPHDKTQEKKKNTSAEQLRLPVFLSVESSALSNTFLSRVPYPWTSQPGMGLGCVESVQGMLRELEMVAAPPPPPMATTAY
ncbi:hypothetical protein HDV05_000192 [Chytridiales sp. JEL 0842]|nr:hypothetical protein HDV05_000192 [Chytridiales sp. JEL 0842]